MGAEGLYFFTFGVFLTASLVSGLGFARLSMPRIERRLQENGHPRPASWDAVGLRIYLYANAILWSQKRNTGNALYEHVPAIKRHATAFDRVLSAVLMVSSVLVPILAIYGVWAFDL